MIHIGIDPGLHGAVGALDDIGDIVLLADLPVIRDLSLPWIDGSAFQSLILGALEGRTARATIERVSSMPGQGIASSFQFGVGFGSIVGVLQAMHISISFVTPSVWKKSYGLSKDTHASLRKARLTYPAAELHVAKQDGGAESLLIASCGGRTFKGAA